MWVWLFGCGCIRISLCVLSFEGVLYVDCFL